MIALRLLSDLQKVKNQFEGVFSPILIAHGYGGLICEQVRVFETFDNEFSTKFACTRRTSSAVKCLGGTA